jgi:hypothetical protein
MSSAILDSPWLKHPKPWWQPLLTVLVTLYGIIFKGWDLQPIVYLFWWETILIVGTSLIRMLFALDSRPVMETLFTKIWLLFGGLILGATMMMLSVAFTFKAFDSAVQAGSFSGVPRESMVLTLSYLLGLILHFFGNGRYKTANPGGELMIGFVHVLLILAPLQALTMHLIPKYPQINQALWVTVALVVIKFLVDTLFMRFGRSIA